MDSDFNKKVALSVGLTAASGPALLAYNVAPSPTFLNQALAFGLWGAFVALSRPLGSPAQLGKAGPLWAATKRAVPAVVPAAKQRTLENRTGRKPQLIRPAARTTAAPQRTARPRKAAPCAGEKCQT